MRRCEECKQEVPPTDDEITAERVHCFRAAFNMMKDLWGREPSPYEVLMAARFLANDDTVTQVQMGDEDE